MKPYLSTAQNLSSKLYKLEIMNFTIRNITSDRQIGKQHISKTGNSGQALLLGHSLFSILQVNAIVRMAGKGTYVMNQYVLKIVKEYASKSVYWKSSGTGEKNMKKR